MSSARILKKFAGQHLLFLLCFFVIATFFTYFLIMQHKVKGFSSQFCFSCILLAAIYLSCKCAFLLVLQIHVCFFACIFRFYFNGFCPTISLQVILAFRAAHVNVANKSSTRKPQQKELHKKCKKQLQQHQ